MVTSLAGRLLVAPPSLVDPNFSGTVVMVLVHNDEGAFGLVLNRRAEGTVESLLPAWSGLCSPAWLFEGGPVEPGTAIALAHVDRRIVSDGWSPITGRLGTVDLRRPPEEIGGIEAVRVFVGYSGWGPGQLDAECDMGGWLIVDADPDDVFDADPDSLWPRVLARQRGELRWLANFPPDVAVN